ncbi:Uncharacterised protein [Vibrio cholerae]|nr:Uncharacterised protein [Vibrio cholerae]
MSADAYLGGMIATRTDVCQSPAPRVNVRFSQTTLGVLGSVHNRSDRSYVT